MPPASWRTRSCPLAETCADRYAGGRAGMAASASTRRLALLHLDERDAAAVRRRPCAAGAELGVDKAALREAGGGGPAGRPIAHHLVPDTLLDGELDGFAPFKTPGDRGDLARAKAEMAKSKYATRRGVCIAKACKAAYLAPLLDCPCYAAGQRIAPLVRESAAKLGITLAQHSFRFDRFLDPSRNIPMVVNADYWVAGPSDPSIFVDRLFGGASIARSTWNASLVGITPAQAARLGVKGRVKCAERRRRHRRVQRTRRPRAHRVLRPTRPQLTAEVVPADPARLAEPHQHPRPTGRQMGIRPVERHDQLRARRGQRLRERREELSSTVGGASRERT